MNEIKQLILIRHGATDWNITGRRNSFTDISMNEGGRTEVTRLAEYLKLAFPEAKVWASPAKRAQETATIIANALVTSFETIPDATEVNFGRFEGKTPEELDVEPEAIHYRAWENGELVEGVESLDEAAHRAKRVFDEITSSKNANHDILISHGAFIRVLICVMAIHASPASYPNLLMDNGSISILRITKKRIRLSQLNNKCYLIR